MRVLAIDPGASTGICIADLDKQNDTATIIHYDYLNVDTSSNYQGDHCIDLMNKIELLIKTWNIKAVCIEDYFASGRFASGTDINYFYRAACHIKCRQLGIPYEILNISAWKSFIAGRSQPTKDQKKKWGKEAAKKLFIQQALYERFNIRFPNHSISELTQKPIVFRYDIVDVVGQMIYYCGLLNGVKRILVTVPIPKDVVFKKVSKKTYTYP
jgi:Holliday junction resolvasome RuvABC endonuclease subunit